MKSETWNLTIEPGGKAELLYMAGNDTDNNGGAVYQFSYEVANPSGVCTLNVDRRNSNSGVHFQNPPAFSNTITPGGVLATFDTALWMYQRLEIENTHATDAVTVTVTRCVRSVYPSR